MDTLTLPFFLFVLPLLSSVQAARTEFLSQVIYDNRMLYWYIKVRETGETEW